MFLGPRGPNGSTLTVGTCDTQASYGRSFRLGLPILVVYSSQRTKLPYAYR